MDNLLSIFDSQSLLLSGSRQTDNVQLRVSLCLASRATRAGRCGAVDRSGERMVIGWLKGL